MSSMAGSAQAEQLERPGAQIKQRLEEIEAPVEDVSVSWINSDPVAAELLVEVVLPDAEKDRKWAERGTWKQELVRQVRDTIRAATAESVPWAVSTPRFVPSGGWVARGKAKDQVDPKRLLSHTAALEAVGLL
jgi:hypothetical protein